ncbi:hypothetical protein [Streptomyces sp. NPDC051286]
MRGTVPVAQLADSPFVGRTGLVGSGIETSLTAVEVPRPLR